MALPVLDPADLEKFSLVLNGAPLMITGDQTGTASAANPSGLRLAGGNLFRDYSPWTEQEIDSFVNGFGHAKMGENGFWGTRGGPLNTLLDDIRLHRDNVARAIATDKPFDTTWTTDPWAEMGFARANDDNLYAFIGYKIFKYTESSDTWAEWLDVRGTIFPASSAATTTPATYNDFYIIDMCQYDDYLIIVTTPRFRKVEPGGAGAPWLGEFFVAAGSGTPEYVSMPNVFAIRTKDKIPAIVGGRSDSGFDFWSLPLQHYSTYAPPYQNWVIATGKIKRILCTTKVHQYGGYLFFGGSAGFGYTNGSGEPQSWVIEGAGAEQSQYTYASGAPQKLKTPYSVSTFHGGDNWVTGFAGIQGQTIGEFSVYMSTSSSLYMLDMAVPALVKVMSYSGTNVRNGNGMLSHNNDIYIPIGAGLWRFTQQGQFVAVGADQVPESPAYGSGNDFDIMTYQHLWLASTPGTLLSAMSGRDKIGGQYAMNVMGLKGQGWHVAQSHTGAIHHVPDIQSLFSMFAVLRSFSFWNTNIARTKFADNDADNFAIGEADGYDTSGYIHLGFFAAGSPLLAKDWESISIYGRCFDANHTAEVQYQILDTPTECDWLFEIAEPGDWVSAGIMNGGTDKEFVIPSSNDCADSRAGKYIAVRIWLRSTGGVGTPIVDGIKLKYFTPIGDYFRFSYSVSLPYLCLNDLCGDPLPEYDQALWDEALREAACAVEPVQFRDIDGKWYLIRVESESRRIDKVDYVGPPDYRTFDITWNLVFIQVKTPTICDDSWVSLCP